MQHLIRRHLLPASAALLIVLAGCASIPPADEAAPPARDEETAEAERPEEPEARREPVLTVPEAYESISLSVQAGDPDAAIAAYEEAELEDPDDPQTRALLANLYLIAGQVEEADAILEGVLARDPENTDALFLRALIQGARGEEDEQRELLEQVLEIDPEHARARAALAELQVQDRSYSAAAENFREVLDDEPDNLVARVGLGNVLLRQERYEQAEEELSEAIELDPEYSFAYSDRARARALQYELGSAEEDLTTAIELEPDHYWHYIDRGRVRMERRRFAGAEADFSRALEINDELFLAYALRARATDARIADAQEPDVMETVRAAIADYESALERRPDYSPAYAPLGVLYYMDEQFGAAFDYLSRAWEEDERRYDLALLAAIALKSQRREEEAAEFLEDLLPSVPRDSLYWDMIRYYLQPRNEGYVMSRIREETDETIQAQMYFYAGAQLELLGRVQTAQAAYLEAEDRLQPGFMERRLASWRLRAYRSQEEDRGE